jgi:hypothetical protein
METRLCVGCDAPLIKKPGKGRWPSRCDPCRTEVRNMASRDRSARRRAKLKASLTPGPGAGSATTSVSASMAAKARWSKIDPEQRREIMTALALARHGGIAPREPREPLPSRSCEFCGVSIRRHPRARTCAAIECIRERNRIRGRKYQHERRARLRGNDAERFEPIEVYERDGWTCGICALPVDPALTWPDPLSVSLDHITPVSLGGSHTRENTRCSHLGCNSKRGNRVA